MAEPIASLPMYDWPEVRADLQELWTLARAQLSAQGISAPQGLSHTPSPFEHWMSGDLLVSQTCGWPYANRLRGTVHPFARFDHGLKNCPPGHYQSVLIGRSATDRQYLKDAKSLLACPAIAVNSDDSQSGFHVFAEFLDGLPVTRIQVGQRVTTGSHRKSVLAVANGKARIAAIDAIAFELAKLHEPEAALRVLVLGYSAPRPGLPLITSEKNASLAPALRSAMTHAISSVSRGTRERLRIFGIVDATDADYASFVSSRNA